MPLPDQGKDIASSTQAHHRRDLGTYHRTRSGSEAVVEICHHAQDQDDNLQHGQQESAQNVAKLAVVMVERNIAWKEQLSEVREGEKQRDSAGFEQPAW